jgi:hypothetical protein
MKSLDPSRVDILTALKELEPLDESGDPDATIKLPKYVSAGLKTAKESIQYKLQELENLQAVPERDGMREGIRRITEHYKKIINRL